MTLALMMPLASMATVPNDTTLTMGNDSIVINQDNGKTTVQVFNRQGMEMKKTREVEFVDSQEIERVYVTSPFIPSKQKKSTDGNRPESHYPIAYIGFNMLPGSVMGMNGSNSLPTKNYSSLEWGVNAMELAYGLNKSVSITSAVGIGLIRNQFHSGNIMTNVDGKTTMRTEEGKEVKKSYLDYVALRIPVMAEWTKPIKRNDIYAAIGLSLEMRGIIRSRYKIGDKTRTETDDLNCHKFGLNLELFAGYANIMIYGRASLTPLMNTSSAPRCYPLLIGIGIRI